MKNILLFKKPSRLLFWSFALVLFLLPRESFGQFSITGTGSGNTHTQNFNAFAGSSATLPANWAIAGTISSYNATLITAGTTSFTTVSGNNWYAARPNGSSTDNAIVMKHSTSGSSTLTFSVKNDTGSTLNGFVIGWNSEQYSTASRATTLDFTYRLGAASFGTTGITGTTLTTGTTGSDAVVAANAVISNSRSITITGISLAAGGTADFRFTIANGASSGSNVHIGIDDFTMYATTATPTPVLNSTTLGSALTTTYGTASTAVSTTVSGTNLTGTITATPQTNFEVSSTSATSGFQSTALSGLANGATIWVRLAANALVSGSKNGVAAVALTSTGATGVNVLTSVAGNSVTPASLTITAGNKTVVYGSTVAALTSSGTYVPTGFVNSETATVITGSPSYTTNYTNTTPAGTSGITITPVVGTLVAANYSFIYASGTVTINKANSSISITGGSATYAYNGAGHGPTNASVTGSTGVVTFAYTGTGATTYGPSATLPTDVGTYQAVASVASDTNFNAASSAAFNYSITSEPVPVINSTLTATATYGVAATSYFITATNNPTSFNATGLPNGLNVNTATGEISGTATALPGNFNVSITATNGGGTSIAATLVYTISPKALTVVSAAANSKVYDRSNAAVITGTLDGIVGADDVTLNGTGTFASVNVNTGITVTSTSTLGGAKAAYYSLTQPTGLTADITAKTLTVTGATVTSRAYNGTNVAAITGASFVAGGVISPDVVTLSGGGTFASVNVATGIAVTANLVSTGTGSTNYTFAQPNGLTGNITLAPLTITGVTANNKAYDGTNTATLNTASATYSGLQNGETFAVAGTPTATFNNATVANGKAVTVTGFTAPSTNYSVSQPTGLTANITAATAPALTASATATVDGPFEITFTDDSLWRNGISAITYDGTTIIASAYDKTQAGKIVFTPALSAALQTAKISKNIVITSTGYSSNTVAQTISAGAPNKLAITTQPTAPATNGATLAAQPVVVIRDQYNNLTSSTATVTAAAVQGTWTLGGTLGVSAVNGTTTFSGLTATSSAAVTGATITFTSAGLTSVTSSAFNIAAPPPVNDECSGATTLTANQPAISGTNVGSTKSAGVAAPSSCTNGNATGGYATNSLVGDVWYKITVPVSGTVVTIKTSGSGGLTDTAMALYSGTCGSLTQLACNDDSDTDSFSLISYTTTQSDLILYARVWDYQNNDAGTFNIQATAVEPVPTITATPSAVPAMTAVVGGTPDTETIAISGIHMEGNINVALTNNVANNFSISPSSFTTTGGNLVVTYTPATAGTHTATVTLSSLNAQDVVLTLNGTASLAAPVAQAANPISSNGFTAHWDAVAGAQSYNVDVYTSQASLTPNVTAVGWNFSDSNATADTGVSNNLNKILTTNSTTPTFSNVGSNPGGLAASSTGPGWSSGSGSTFWKVSFETTGFSNLKLSSRQRSSNAGPRDFKVQYSTDDSFWTDVPNANIVLTGGSNWISLTNITLPEDCANKPLVYLRWIMTSNTRANLASGDTTGDSAIDDITITGDQNTSINSSIPGSPFTGITATSYQVTNLQPTTEYHYVVKAVSAAVTSSNSNAITVTTTLPAPNQPSVLTGADIVCANSSQTYSVVNDSAATSYSWTLPSGWIGTSTTNSITVTAGSTGGTISVVAVNSAGPSTARNLAVTVNPLQTPTVVLSSTDSDNTFAYGTSVTFTATASGVSGNTGIVYDFKVDGISRQSGSSNAFTTTAISDQQQVTVSIAVTGGTCMQASTANSNSITNTVSGAVLVHISNYCGQTLPFLTTPIYSSTATVSGNPTVQYQFRVQKVGGASQTLALRSTPSFSLTQTSLYAYNTSFEVYVSAVINGIVQPESAACVITTPAIVPPATVQSTYCGSTLADAYSPIFAAPVPGATGYSFDVFQGSTRISTVVRDVNYFYLSNLPSWTYNTSYTVYVAVKINNEPFGSFGTVPCTVTTPQLSTPGLVACGTQMATVSSPVFTTTVPGATNYAFEITGPGVNGVIVNRSVPYFYLTSITNWNYGTSYTIKVRVTKGSEVGPQSAGCILTTPAIPSTAVRASQCDQLLANAATVIFADPVYGASNYVFKINDGTNPEFSLTRNVNYFSMTSVPTWEYNTVYTVTVQAVRNNSTSPVVTVCSITTPEGPFTTIQDGMCNNPTLTKSGSLTVDAHPNASSYNFFIEQYDENSQVVARYSKVVYTNSLLLSSVPGLPTPTNQEGVTYAWGVQIAVMGKYGEETKGCSFTLVPTPSGRMAETVFSATAYPNPFASNFMIDVKTKSQSVVNVKVYDMVGRLIEQRDVRVSDLETSSIGDRYPSGVYNVVVAQDDNLETVRVIKR